jgi:putative transposase
MSRGNERKAIVRSNEDRERFTEVLTEGASRFNILIHGYCLMTNHYHLLVETPDGNLSYAMRYINGVYTQRFNAMNKSVGHVFQGRYKAILIEKDEYLLCLCRYIERNPVRAGLVAHPGEYAWSSYRAISGIDDSDAGFITADWILSQFARKREEGKKRYIAYIEEPDADRDKPFDFVRGSCFLGTDAFISSFDEDVWDKEDIEEINRAQRYVNRPPLAALISTEQSLNKKIRNQRIHEAVYEFGYSQREISDHTGLHYVTVSRILKDIGGKR